MALVAGKKRSRFGVRGRAARVIDVLWYGFNSSATLPPHPKLRSRSKFHLFASLAILAQSPRPKASPLPFFPRLSFPARLLRRGLSGSVNELTKFQSAACGKQVRVCSLLQVSLKPLTSSEPAAL